MSGQSQAANLGGMLSQIGGAIGGMGSAGNALMRPIENMSRPDVADPNSIQQQQRLMDWQNQMGRTDAARTTMAGIRDLREQQVLAAEEARKQQALKGQQVMANIEQTMGAVLSNPELDDATKLAKLQELQVVANQKSTEHGLDATKYSDMAAQVQQRVNQQELQNIQLTEAKLAKQEAAEIKQLDQELATVFAKGTDSPAYAAFKQKNPLAQKHASYVMRMEAAQRSLEDSTAARAKRQREGERNVDLATTDAIVGQLGDNPLVTERHKALKDRVEAYNKLPTGQRDPSILHNLESEAAKLDAVATQAYQTQLNQQWYEKRDAEARDTAARNSYMTGRRQIAARVVPDKVIKEWRSKNDPAWWDYNAPTLTDAEVEQRIKAEELANYDRLYQQEQAGVTVGTSEFDPATYNGTDQLTPEQAAMLPVGTKFIGQDGKERTRK